MISATAQQTLARFPGDAVAKAWLVKAPTLLATAESYFDQSLLEYQAGRNIRPGGSRSLSRRPGKRSNYALGIPVPGITSPLLQTLCRDWADGIQAAQQAVRLIRIINWRRITWRWLSWSNRNIRPGSDGISDYFLTTGLPNAGGGEAGSVKSRGCVS
jgi:hypothetical protein